MIYNKTYIGVHSTDKIDDGYIGSGRIFKRALRKYGSENFTREIIVFFGKRKDALKAESWIVTDEFIAKNSNYNVTLGGKGGIGLSNKGRKLTLEQRKPRAINSSRPCKESTKKKIGDAHRGRKYSDELVAQMSERFTEYYKTHPHPLKGFRHSEETRKKMGKARIGTKLSEETKRKMSLAKKGIPLIHTRKKVIDINTGRIFASCKEAGNYFGIHKATTLRWLKKGDKIRYYEGEIS